MAILGSLEKDVAALYVAIFGRAPEGEGLNYWVNLAQQNNWSLAQLADAMIEAAKQYPGYENIDDPQTLVEALYQNVLGKTYQDDPDGINFWVSKIQEGLDKGSVVEAILQTAIEQYPNHPATKTLLNRVDVALYTAQKIPTADINGDGQVDQNDLTQFHDFVVKTTDDPTTVQLVEQEVDNIVNKGQEFDLTTNPDEIVGTPKNDFINAVVSSLDVENTLNPDDKIDGGDGTDTINIDVKGNFSGFSSTGYLQNVEIVKLTNTSTIPRTFSTQGIKGAQEYIIDASQAPINISDLDNTNSIIYLQNQKSGTFTVSYASGVTDGTSDEQKLLIENVGTPDDPNTTTNEEQAVAMTINGIETLNLSSIQGDNVISLNGDSVKNLVVEGVGNVKINAVPTPLKTFDASQLNGDTIVDFANASGMTKIATGAGNDKVTIDISDDVLANAQIDGGTGNDELVINGAGTVQFNQTGFEKVTFDKTSGNITYSALNASDIQAFAATQNVANNITLANLGTKDYTVELYGANTSGATISLDNTGIDNIKVTNPSANATTSSPDNNTLGINATNANAIYLTIDDKMKYSGNLQAPNAKYLKIDASGEAALGAASNLTSIEQLDIVANNAVDVSGSGAISLNKVASVNLSGNGSVTLGPLGSTTLDYGITLNASELPKGLTVGNINTYGANVNLDVSNVTGTVTIGNINTANGAPTAGDVLINAQNTLDAVTLGTITAKNVTIDATNAINGVTYGTITINDGGTLDLKGSQLKPNTVTVNLAGSNDETIKVVGGIQNDTIIIGAAGFTGKATIDVTGDLGSDTIQLTGSVDATNGFTFDGVETIDVNGNILKVNASDINGKTFTLADTATGGTLDVIGTNTNDTIDLTNITNNTTITVEAGKGDDTIKGSGGNDDIYGGFGKDTITTGNGNDKVILDSPFEAADKITDFAANAADHLYIDIQRNTSAAFGATNQVPSVVVPAASKSKLQVLNTSGSKLKQSVVTAGTALTKATISSAATIKKIFVGKSIKVSNNVGGGATDKLKIITSAGSAVFSKATNSGKAIMFFYDTDDKKLQMIYLTWGTVTKSNKITGDISIKSIKTIATLTVTSVKNLDASDILIF